MAEERPTLVRIKRKRSDEPLDVFWLEERNARKRREVDFGGLSLQDPPSGHAKVLFRRLQTVQISQVQDVSFSESLMSELSAKRTDKQDARKCAFKETKRPSSSAREQQQSFSRAARYEQVWRNRRGNDTMHNYFHLYDVERRDEEEEQRRDEELLMKYMPLLKEYCPEEFGGTDNKDETADEFVYDVYIPESDVQLEDSVDDLLTVEVSDAFDFGLHEEFESDHDSEDSNREDHPNCDYPDEEDEDEDGSSKDDSYCDSDEEEDEEDW